MITITLPTALEERLAREAKKLGTTVELLAVQKLSEPTVSVPLGQVTESTETLYDALKDYIGIADSGNPNRSTHTGKQFTDILEEKARRGKL